MVPVRTPFARAPNLTPPTGNPREKRTKEKVGNEARILNGRDLSDPVTLYHIHISYIHASLFHSLAPKTRKVLSMPLSTSFLPKSTNRAPVKSPALSSNTHNSSHDLLAYTLASVPTTLRN
jgi:hypothetical protein